MDYSTSSLWTDLFPIEGVSGYILLLPCFIEIPVFNAKSVDPDQMLQNMASYLGLHYLPMSLLYDAWHEWVKEELRISSDKKFFELCLKS